MSQLRMKVLIISAIIAILALTVLSSPLVIRADRAATRKANADKAEALKAKFDGLNEDSSCEPNEVGCVKDAFAKCATVAGKDGKLVNKFQVTECNGDLVCRPLPLVNSEGTSVVCTTQKDFEERIDQARKNL